MELIISLLTSLDNGLLMLHRFSTSITQGSRPQCLPSAPAIFTFVLKYCGTGFLEETDQFARSRGNSHNLGPDLWAVFSTETKKREFTVWRHMVLKMALTFQITLTDVSRLIFAVVL